MSRNVVHWRASSSFLICNESELTKSYSILSWAESLNKYHSAICHTLSKQELWNSKVFASLQMSQKYFVTLQRCKIISFLTCTVVYISHTIICFLFLTELLENLPLLSDKLFIPDVHHAIFSPQKWQNPGLKAIVRFAWSLTLRALSQYPSVPG